MRKLPIQATFVTREGFGKPMEIDELRPVIRFPKFPKMQFLATESTSDIPDMIESMSIDFQLEKYKVVKQKNGKEHIVATYREI